MLEEEESTVGFPSEFVSPKDKEKPAYGVQYAKAMYGASNRVGPRDIFDNYDYDELILIAQGRESVDRIRRVMGHHETPNEQDESYDLTYIDVEVLNLAPKYINRAVAKMQKYSYDINVDAVDPVSVDERAAHAASIEAFYRTNNWLMEMGINAKAMFPELDVEMLPKYMDELMYGATVNPKIKKEIWAEIAIKLLHYINDFQQVMREVDWDLVVVGSGHLHFYEDENGVPRCERINDKYFIGSYVDNESSDDREYAGFLDWVTIDQLRKEMLASGFTEEQIKEQTAKWDYAIPASIDYTGNFDRFDGLTYIPIMRFYFRSEDNRTYVKKKGQKYGDDQIFEKAFNYKPEETVQQYFQTGERKLIKNTYCSIYGGTWIIDSDVVYNYGRKKLPRLNLVNSTLPIVSFSPNAKEGRKVSFCAQMKEELFMINVTHNKIKEILGKGWMGLREFDFNQLESVKLGKGGTEWTPRQVFEFIMKTNIVPKRTQVNQWEQAVAGATVQDVAAGITLADYFNTMDRYIMLLEQMTSTSVVDSIQVPDRLSATAAKQSAQTSDIDMEYLYNAHENLYKKGTHQMLLMLQESLKDPKKAQVFVQSMGKVNTRIFEAPEDAAYCEYGLQLTRKPTEEMWAQFYADVSIALQNQDIGLADSVFLREIDNLKQARQVMVIRAEQFRRKRMEEAKFMNDLAIESNQAAAMSKAQMEIEKDRQKFQMQAELELLKGKITETLKGGELRAQQNMAYIEGQFKEKISRQLNLANHLKESLRSRTEQYKADSKVKETVINAVQKADSDKKAAQKTKAK